MLFFAGAAFFWRLGDEWAATYRNASLVDARLESLGKQQGMSDTAIQSIKDMSTALPV